ncbi:cytochrome bd oxidase small subunit, CydX/CbdX family [Dongshaea marina]
MWYITWVIGVHMAILLCSVIALSMEKH